MSKWPSLTVAELQRAGALLVEDGNHGEYHPRPHEFVDEGTAFIRAADLSNGQVRFRLSGRVNDAAVSRIRKGIGQPGDILFSHKGTVGKLARVGSDAPPFVCSPQTTFWRVLDESMLSRAYLYAFMRSHAFIDQWWVRKGETDMADYVSLTAQRQLRVAVPPLAVQQRIASPLTAIDDLIENNWRRIEVLQEMARATYREWFVHFRYPGHEKARFVDSSIGEVPEGWLVAPASAALAINPRVKLDKALEHPFVTMGDLDERNMIFTSSELRAGNSGAKFVNADTLFARITPCLENGKTGYVQCLDDAQVGRGSTEFIVLRGGAVGPAFTYCLARSEEFRAHAIASMSGASGRQRVRNECFDAYLLGVPPRHLVDRFEGISGPLFETAHRLSLQSRKLSLLRNLLLPKMVTGQIDVSSLDLDMLFEGSAA